MLCLQDRQPVQGRVAIHEVAMHAAAPGAAVKFVPSVNINGNQGLLKPVCCACDS
jgi:hypothetical protein